MNQKDISGNMPPQEPLPAGGKTASFAYETSGGITLDFHSAEFNRLDDLNDGSGNYRTFQPLTGVVTADMRHQMERRNRPDTGDAVDRGADLPKTMAPEGQEVGSSPDAAPLTVISQGRTLIVDRDAGRAIACAKRLSGQGLACTLLVVNDAAPGPFSPWFDQFRLLEVGSVSVAGAFGGYLATVTTNGESRPLQEGSGDGASLFDLVLDLQPTPSYTGDGLPMGYYAPGPDPAALREAMAELPEMKGRFQRPQFTAFEKSRCLHGRSLTRDCCRCLAVCPFGAIQSSKRTISLDPYRCQGCGACALVCPADALQMVHPSWEERLGTLRRRLEKQPAGAACPPTLVIAERETACSHGASGNSEENQDHRIPFDVEQIGHAGLELLLGSLACGAGAVVVVCGARTPQGLRETIEGQARMGRAVLQGLGLAEDKIRFAVAPPENGPAEEPAFATTGPAVQAGNPFLPPAAFCAAQGRRTLVRQAAQHLYDQFGANRQPAIPLPAGSPFGAVAVEPAACTLCMACAVACPTGALSAAGDVPRIEFIESRCHQCGLCEEACPEGALHLAPRLLCDADAVCTPAILHEAEPVRCIACGLPFASQAMIDRIRTKLAGHWMYAADRQLRRLQMCRTCRTQDALASEDMKLWNHS